MYKYLGTLTTGQSHCVCKPPHREVGHCGQYTASLLYLPFSIVGSSRQARRHAQGSFFLQRPRHWKAQQGQSELVASKTVAASTLPLHQHQTTNSLRLSSSVVSVCVCTRACSTWANPPNLALFFFFTNDTTLTIGLAVAVTPTATAAVAFPLFDFGSLVDVLCSANSVCFLAPRSHSSTLHLQSSLFTFSDLSISHPLSFSRLTVFASSLNHDRPSLHATNDQDGS